jgi:hypothetical protein
MSQPYYFCKRCQAYSIGHICLYCKHIPEERKLKWGLAWKLQWTC